MGRGQLKYRKRGGRGGPSSGGRGQAGRGGTGSGNDAAPAPAPKTKRRGRGGGQHSSTSHLPSNTERWGLSFGEDNRGQQGRRTGLTSSSAVSFEETERLLDESEWATGASSWRLGAVTTEEARDEDGDQIEAAAAAASSELLSLNLDMLEKCLRRSSVHERLRLPLPHTYAAELEVDIREDPALEPVVASPTLKRKPGGSECARAARVGGGGGGRGTGEEAGTEAGASTKSREGGPSVAVGGGGGGSGGGGGGGGAGGGPAATGGGDEDGVLDALLDLPAAGAGAGGDSSTAGEPGPAISSPGRAAITTSLPPTYLSPGRGHGHDGGRGEGGVPTEPAEAARSRSGGGPAAEAVGGGVDGSGTGTGEGGASGGGGGGGGGGDADELEDWLDDMLADA